MRERGVVGLEKGRGHTRSDQKAVVAFEKGVVALEREEE